MTSPSVAAKRRVAASIVTALTCACVFSGCGGAGASGGYASVYKPNGSATITPGQTLTVDLGRMDFQPNTLTAPKGATVTLLLKNDSALRHNFSLDAFHVSQNVGPGQSATATFTAAQTGTFYFYCNVPGHARAGMVGELTVQ